MSGANLVVKKKRKPRVTYSDLPIQVAERSLSRAEFIFEVTNGTSDTIYSILERLNKALNEIVGLTDDSYSFNEIVNRGTVSLDFNTVQHFKAELIGLFSMQQLSAQVIIDSKVNFELKVEENQLCIEIIKGAYVKISDKGKFYRAELMNIEIQNTVNGEVLFLADCIYFPTKNGNSKILNLMLSANRDSGIGACSNSMAKRDSMKKFRQSYVDLESISKCNSLERKLDFTVKGLKMWFRNVIVDRFCN